MTWSYDYFFSFVRTQFASEKSDLKIRIAACSLKLVSYIWDFKIFINISILYIHEVDLEKRSNCYYSYRYRDFNVIASLTTHGTINDSYLNDVSFSQDSIAFHI